MKYLPIIPSSLLDLGRSDESVDAFLKSYSDLSLRVGVVLKAYDITDEENVSKKDIEYDVLAFTQDKDLASVPVKYKKCKTADFFGGKADFFEYTLREPSADPINDDLKKITDGSFVLLLCVNGQSDNARIIAGIRHNKRETTLTKEKGHHLEGEFNGLNFQINKEGELTITYKSKSSNDGKYADEEAGGTFIEINKTGQVDINTGLEGTDETYMRMDKANKDVGLKAGQHIGFTAQKNIGLIAKENINITATKDLIAKAEGKAAFTIGSTLNIKAESEITVAAITQNFKADNMIQMQANLINVKGQIVNLGQGGPPALTMSTLFLGTGNVGAPVISQAIGPFSASVFFS